MRVCEAENVLLCETRAQNHVRDAKNIADNT